MSSCAVFANIYDAPLGDYQTLDILFALDHLYSREGVNKFYTAENRCFDKFCEHWLERKNYFPTEIYRFPSDDPYEKYFNDKYTSPKIFFADYILCDETTVNFVKNHINVKYIIEYPKTKIYIVGKNKQLI